MSCVGGRGRAGGGAGQGLRPGCPCWWRAQARAAGEGGRVNRAGCAHPPGCPRRWCACLRAALGPAGRAVCRAGSVWEALVGTQQRWERSRHWYSTASRRLECRRAHLRSQLLPDILGQAALPPCRGSCRSVAARLLLLPLLPSGVGCLGAGPGSGGVHDSQVRALPLLLLLLPPLLPLARAPSRSVALPRVPSIPLLLLLLPLLAQRPLAAAAAAATAAIRLRCTCARRLGIRRMPRPVRCQPLCQPWVPLAGRRGLRRCDILPLHAIRLCRCCCCLLLRLLRMWPLLLVLLLLIQDGKALLHLCQQLPRRAAPLLPFPRPCVAAPQHRRQALPQGQLLLPLARGALRLCGSRPGAGGTGEPALQGVPQVTYRQRQLQAGPAGHNHAMAAARGASSGAAMPCSTSISISSKALPACTWRPTAPPTPPPLPKPSPEGRWPHLAAAAAAGRWSPPAQPPGTSQK